MDCGSCSVLKLKRKHTAVAVRLGCCRHLMGCLYLYCPQLEFPLRGPGCRRKASWSRARGPLHTRRRRRQGGNHLRIAGQLIDTGTGAHLGADRFDGALEDTFDLQDRVTASVVGAIASNLQRAEIERAKHEPTESLNAYDYSHWQTNAAAGFAVDFANSISPMHFHHSSHRNT
jgi:hypothetical protein